MFYEAVPHERSFRSFDSPFSNTTLVIFSTTRFRCLNVRGSPCWAAVDVAWNHCCGFGQVGALWILQQLLLSFSLSSTVQHSVGQPSSTRYTAHSLFKAPPSGWKVTTNFFTLVLTRSEFLRSLLNTDAQKSKLILVLFYSAITIITQSMTMTQ